MNSPDAAFEWLLSSGYAQDNHLGFVHIIKPPKLKHLHLFVSAIKTLGAWSVDSSSNAGKVEITCGGKPSELIFRARNRWKTLSNQKCCCGGSLEVFTSRPVGFWSSDKIRCVACGKAGIVALEKGSNHELLWD